MPRPICITVQVPPGHVAAIQSELTDGDADVLGRYVHHVGQLFATKAVRDGLPCDLSIKFVPALFGGSIEANLPDDDTLAIVLHRLRPLILQKESASFVNTCAVLGKHLADANVRAILREQRELFQNSDRAQTWALSSNDVRVNAENVLQDWLNGVEYHTDSERRMRIEQLLQGSEVLVRHALVSMLLNKIDAIEAIGALARVVVGTLQTVRFEPDSSQSRAVIIVSRCRSAGDSADRVEL